jgi:hypothetical protein
MSNPSMQRATRAFAGAPLAVLACVALALSSAGPAAAQRRSSAPATTASAPAVAADMPDATVRAAFSELTAILYAPPSDARDQEVAALLLRYVDFEEMTRRSFGEPCPQTGCVDHWAELTMAERTEAIGLVQSSLTEHWTRQLARSPSYDVDIQPAVPHTQEIRVRVIARPRDGVGATETIDLFFLPRRTPYKLVDVRSGSSRITHSRYKQYDHWLTSPGQGYPYLVSRLRKPAEREASAPREAEAPSPTTDETDAAPDDSPEDTSDLAPAPAPAVQEDRGISWWKLTLGGALLLALGVWLGRLRRKP